MNRFNIIAITHKTLPIEEVGNFHIEEARQLLVLSEAKNNLAIGELMFLSTCNRVEFLISDHREINAAYLNTFLSLVYPHLGAEYIEKVIPSVVVYEGEHALRHMLEVASSLDSLVVGEREIITQVRNAYENSKKWKITGDLIRLVVRKTIESAKEVYTHTNISRNPVSVVSLAYRKLKELNVKLDARFIIIGSGITNTTMAKYLKKHGFTNFVIFNRTPANAEKLAKEISARAFPLDQLKNYNEGFDVIVTCTGSADHILSKDIYTSLIGDDKSKKIVIDLAVPSDLDPEILNSYDVNLIAVNNLQEIAARNLKEREKELVACREIVEKNIEEFRQMYKTRQVELAMSEVPRRVKEIKETALNEVFAQEIGQMDQQSKEVLDKVIAYLEKKYISGPMKLAREIMLDSTTTK